MLLGRAEQRVTQSRASVAPPSDRLSPEAELEAILPNDVLAALDEPLDLDDGDESDAGAPGLPGYPIPEEAKTQAHYIEGDVPGGGTSGDRHLLIVDRDRWLLYESYATRWNSSLQRWEAGSGDDRAFLEAFYAALRARLEGDMRFGKRKKDKFSSSG